MLFCIDKQHLYSTAKLSTLAEQADRQVTLNSPWIGSILINSPLYGGFCSIASFMELYVLL